jgi:hypothetical protein
MVRAMFVQETLVERGFIGARDSARVDAREEVREVDPDGSGGEADRQRFRGELAKNATAAGAERTPSSRVGFMPSSVRDVQPLEPLGSCIAGKDRGGSARGGLRRLKAPKSMGKISSPGSFDSAP